MKSRLAILTTLVAGMLLSTTGAGLAVTSLSSSHDSAAVSQYKPTPTTTPTSPGSVLGESNGNQPKDHKPSGTLGENAGGGTAGESTSLQPTRQAENGAGGSLPFTGFLAIPVLLGGVALLTAGLVLRRRAADDRA